MLSDVIKKSWDIETAIKVGIYLINEGYDLKRSSTFVGDHYLRDKAVKCVLCLHGHTFDGQRDNRIGVHFPLSDCYPSVRDL
ncbi:MAG: DUF434 domain-containing protein, partial [Lachnospiraceae bacterium]|nr:DUF434 domain-containing protein [Lachnospiraceae bacterium]